MEDITGRSTPIGVQRHQCFHSNVPVSVFFHIRTVGRQYPLKPLIPTLRILGKTLIKRYGFYCNILLICLFAFQGQCLAVFRSITFAGLQQIVTLLNNLQTVVPHSHHFIGCMEKHGSRHLVYRRFVTQCDNLAIGSPTATVEQIMEPNALSTLVAVVFSSKTPPLQVSDTFKGVSLRFVITERTKAVREVANTTQ